jgi:hypothetical protein
MDANTSSTWGDPRVRRKGKTQLLFDDNRFSSGRPESYNRNTGEAETDRAGELPDRGIARAELIADEKGPGPIFLYGFS